MAQKPQPHAGRPPRANDTTTYTVPPSRMMRFMVSQRVPVVCKGHARSGNLDHPLRFCTARKKRPGNRLVGLGKVRTGPQQDDTVRQITGRVVDRKVCLQRLERARVGDRRIHERVRVLDLAVQHLECDCYQEQIEMFTPVLLMRETIHADPHRPVRSVWVLDASDISDNNWNSVDHTFAGLLTATCTPIPCFRRAVLMSRTTWSISAADIPGTRLDTPCGFPRQS